MTDLIYIFEWWVVLFLLGITFLPLTSKIFSSFFDSGYIFSKIIGILVISYLSWIFSSFHLLPFSTSTLYGLVGAILGINLVLIFTKKIRLKIYNFRFMILSEVFFTVGFIAWAFIRAHEPSIHGLEKFMDFGIINSILRTEYFPPKDIWMTPLTINYYYFGHLVAAVLTKLSNIDSVISYNLMLSTLFGLCFSASFSIGANLFHLYRHPEAISGPILNRFRIKSGMTLSGLFSALLVTLGGNLHPIYLFFKTYLPAENPVPFWQLPLMFNFSEYWYPNATRFIPNTIHEFPLYSFVVADLHGHVFSIPFVLLFIAILMVIFSKSSIHHTYYLILGFLVAIFLMTNVLDGPIYLLVITVVLSAKLKSIVLTAKYLFFITVGAVIFSLPFWLNFTPFGQGIGVMCAPKFLTDIGHLGPLLFEADHCSPSPIWMLFILWGFFYLVIAGFIKFVISRKDLTKQSTDYLVLILSLAATILILIPELFYAKDIYPQHYRANTVFKFGYQAFIILGLASGYMLTRIVLNIKTQMAKLSFTIQIIYLSLLTALFSLVIIYPYFAINSYYGALKNNLGLDGLQYLYQTYPNDYQIIKWIRDNISGQPIILEAQGDSYTDYARVSSFTGLPTVLGWPVHEWLWRGDYSLSTNRIPDIQSIYESSDVYLTDQLLKKYHINYVFIGELESQKYPIIQYQKFNQLGKQVFQSGNSVLFQINTNELIPPDTKP